MKTIYLQEICPNLIAPELVIVKPMASISGFITYIKYTAGSTKGATTRGDVFNTPFALGAVDPDYTSERVAETTTAYVDAGNSNAITISLAWTPVVPDEFVCKVAGAEVTGVLSDDRAHITFASGVADGDSVQVAYVYDNVVIPQNDLPLLNAEMANISLFAKARRIAIYYSQIANYQAKTDYGFDLGGQLAEKAVAQLSYEIDTEVTQLLSDNAADEADLVWSKTLPVGVSKSEHYQGFAEVIGIAMQKIYNKTRRFMPNYMLAASDVLPILQFIKGFEAAPTTGINGPFFAGTLNGIKIFVTPNITAGRFVFGVNGDDLMSSAAVYAPYMPIVPTQLLQYADGGTSQGFSTMYDLKMLNADLLVAGKIVA